MYITYGFFYIPVTQKWLIVSFHLPEMTIIASDSWEILVNMPEQKESKLDEILASVLQRNLKIMLNPI